VHARSALFDLYGDHLSARGHWAPIAGIVRLLGTVGLAAPAVRTAVSRMVREGWLAPQESEGQRGYAATDRARSRLAQAHVRIYRTREEPAWDGTWHLVAVERPGERAARARAAAAMAFLGYARLAADTWLAPRRADGLAEALSAEHVGFHGFVGCYDASGAALAASLWDLESLGTAYERFVHDATELVGDLDAMLDAADPEHAFATRTVLVNEWRKFLFRDPGLPAEVLPTPWPGHEAARLFDTSASALQPLARQFIDEALTTAPKGS